MHRVWMQPATNRVPTHADNKQHRHDASVLHKSVWRCGGVSQAREATRQVGPLLSAQRKANKQSTTAGGQAGGTSGRIADQALSARRDSARPDGPRRDPRTTHRRKHPAAAAQKQLIVRRARSCRMPMAAPHRQTRTKDAARRGSMRVSRHRPSRRQALQQRVATNQPSASIARTAPSVLGDRQRRRVFGPTALVSVAETRRPGRRRRFPAPLRIAGTTRRGAPCGGADSRRASHDTLRVKLWPSSREHRTVETFTRRVQHKRPGAERRAQRVDAGRACKATADSAASRKRRHQMRLPAQMRRALRCNVPAFIGSTRASRSRQTRVETLRSIRAAQTAGGTGPTAHPRRRPQGNKQLSADALLRQRLHFRLLFSAACTFLQVRFPEPKWVTALFGALPPMNARRKFAGMWTRLCARCSWQQTDFSRRGRVRIVPASTKRTSASATNRLADTLRR